VTHSHRGTLGSVLLRKWIRSWTVVDNYIRNCSPIVVDPVFDAIRQGVLQFPNKVWYDKVWYYQRGESFSVNHSAWLSRVGKAPSCIVDTSTPQ